MPRFLLEKWPATRRPQGQLRLRFTDDGPLLLTLPRRFVMALIRGYQLTVSPLLPPSCRFHPSCSAYTLEAVRRYGTIKGGWLGARRLLRCHPWNRGGFDPVP